MQIPLAGPAFKHPSQDVNYQRSVNIFPTVTNPVANTSYDPSVTSTENNTQQSLIMLPSPGLKLLTDLGPSPSRLLQTFDIYTYAICGTSVYRLKINSATEMVEESKVLGNLLTDSGTVKAAYNSTQILFVDGLQGFIYTPLNTGKSTPGVIGGSSGNTYTLTINGTTIYNNVLVTTSPVLTDIIHTINTFTNTTNITAALDSASNTIIHLTAIDDRTITVTESGTGFTSGVNGITVTGGDFASPLLAFREVPSTNFPNGATDVKYMGGYFITNNWGTGHIYFSALADGTSWSALDVATAESDTDNVIALGLVKGELWVIGTNSIEIWYNAGNAPPGVPFSPRTDLAIRIGADAQYSPVENNDLLTWLDSRGFIVESSVSTFIRENNSGYDCKIISDEAITAEILGYERRDDAIACSFNDDRGHLMYQITFPTAKKTWVYDYTTQMWHEKAYFNSFSNGLEEHLGQYYTTIDALHLTSGYRDGKIYIVKSTIYDDNGNTIRRIRTTAPIADTNSYNLLFVDRLQLRCETGQANQNTPGNAPIISLRYSNDGGHTWSNYITRSFGQVGQYNLPITWNRLGYGRDWLFEFTLDDPIKFSLINAVIFTDEEQ